MQAKDPLVRMLGILYSAPADPCRWNNFLQELCAACGVSKAALIAHDLSRNDHRILARQGSEIEAGGHLYERYYWQFDEWTSQFCRQRNTGKVLLGEEIWPERSLRKSIYYNEFLDAYDILQLIGIPFTGTPGIVESISLYRSKREDRFGAEQVTMLKIIAPHLKTALETRRRFLALESRVSDLETALDSMQSAMLLVDASGTICFLNKVANRILAESNGLLRDRGTLTARTALESTQLRGLIEKAIATGTGKHVVEAGAMPIHRIGKRPLHIFVAPVSSTESSLPPRAAAVVFIDDPELQPMVPAEILRTLFGLTPAETRLALSVLSGHSVSESAELNGHSRETAKSQMSAVLAKTGTKRQGQLIRLLSRLPHPADF